MDDEDSCDQCGSTDFTVEDDGHTYCANGHEQARGAIIAEDDQDFGRKGKIVRKKEKKKTKQKLSKILRGPKAYQLFLQAWQFILWKQCHTLVHLKAMPAELWTIVRDLWSLWLSKLEHRLHDPSRAQSQTESDTESELQGTSGDELTTDVEADASADDRNPKHTKAVRKGPTLVDTIALNYLGMLLLRIPIELSSILKWIEIEDIPFIRAIRHVPQEMQDRLPGEYHAALDTISLPGAEDLQLAIYHRSMMYDVFFGMVTPPVNHSGLFISYIRSLALPIEVYGLARRLNGIAKYTFSYQDQPNQASSRRQPTRYPEAQIISLVVVATKFLFPFDFEQVKRYPKSPNDLATLRMNWPAWLEAKTEFDNSQFNPTTDGLKRGTEIHVKDADIFNMSDVQLDQYMDWYQRTWLKSTSGLTNTPLSQAQEEAGSDSIDKTILNLFPLRNTPDTSKTREQHDQSAALHESLLTARIKRVQASLTPIRAISTDEEAERASAVLRPGARYARYRNVNDLAQAGDAARTFHEEAARVACLGVHSLLRAVARTEEVIEKWRKEMKRKEVFADEDESEDRAPGHMHPASSGLVRTMDEMDLGHYPSSSARPRVVGPGTDAEDTVEAEDEDEADQGDLEMELAMQYLPEL